MQQVILTIILFFSSLLLANAQESDLKNNERTVTVTVINALSDNGTVKFAFYDKKGFRIEPLFAKSASVENGISSVIFENVPQGEYAILCFHDENNNGRMDFYENGMPVESYGSSNNVMNMGPPEFYSSKFEVAMEDLDLKIKF